VNPKEQEIAIHELEDRVDRLRNIYEQYFLGFERLEPTVPRKDVDRRFAILRKEQIRNTAMRFRFNVVTQKYNTYSMHWVRICRQIEEGTYKRHVRRAKARFGEGPSDPSTIERDISIDIDTTEFDMDEALDAIEAENAARERPSPGTSPPSPRAVSAPAIQAMPRTSLPAAGRRGDDLERTTDTGVHMIGERAARGAALPPGTRPRMIVRKREDGEPSPAVRAPGVPASASGSSSAARIPGAGPPGSSSAARIPSAGPPAGRIPNPGPPAGRSPNPGPAGRSPNPGPAGRIPNPGPAGRIPNPGPSAGRIPNPGAPAPGRIPVVQPASPALHPPVAHQHVAPKGGPVGPQIRPVGSLNPIPMATPVSTPRAPIAPPASAPQPGPAPPASAPRAPAAAPSAPRLPPAPGSSPNLPVPPLPRPSAASYADKDTDPGAPQVRPPGTRPRIPLPLPSQAARPSPPKKE